MGHVVCEQLRVQSVSSSVKQGLVSMATVSVTAWSTVLTPLMKLSVVSGASLMINTWEQYRCHRHSL